MMVAYKFGTLSVLQPILSMNYVLSLILNEEITELKIIDIFIIMLGVCLDNGDAYLLSTKCFLCKNGAEQIWQEKPEN